MHSMLFFGLTALVVIFINATSAFPTHHRHVRRNLKRSERLRPPHLGVGLAANPDVLTYKLVSEKHVRAPRAFGRIGLAANPDVQTWEAASDTAKKDKRQASTFSSSPHVLSLRAVTRRGSNVHPLMYYQQHVNGAHARLARMNNYTVEADVPENGLRRRWESLQMPAEDLKIRKRSSYAGNSLGAMQRRQEDNQVLPNNAEGFTRIELEGLISGEETEGPDNFENTLGLDIMSNDIGYYTDIQIGTPQRDFKILVDSGSADTWVSSQACASCVNKVQLGTRTSTSFAASNQPFQVTYGLGAVQGFIARDNMKIGNLTLDELVFGVTTFESPEFGSDRVLFDGLMGTAILSNQRTLTPIEVLGQAGAVASSAMGYALGRVADGVNDGTVTFGGINTAQMDGALIEVPNVSQVGFWEGRMDEVTVDGRSLGLEVRTAILDTGTTLIIMPEADAIALHSAIPGTRSDGQGGFIIPCNTNASVAFTFSGQSFAIDPRDLPFIPLDPNDPTGDCQSGISAGDIGRANQWLVGDVFLKSVYFATEVDSNTIGLGKRK